MSLEYSNKSPIISEHPQFKPTVFLALKLYSFPLLVLLKRDVFVSTQNINKFSTNFPALFLIFTVAHFHDCQEKNTKR